MNWYRRDESLTNLLPENQTVPEITLNDGNSIIHNPLELSDVFNDHFSSTGSQASK